MINEAVRDVMKERYLLPFEKDENDIFKRVAKAIVKPMGKTKEAKTLESELYNAMADGEMMPNSPALMNLGTKNQMASACFVLPIEDSMEGIFNTMKDAALVHKAGGGSGFCFSDLRPSGKLVSTTNGKASGPISFLKVYDKATGVVKQAGKRRGANMGTFDISAPDIEEFITCKDKDGDISNFNLSTMLTDDFMKAVENDSDWDLQWKGEVSKTVKARYLFDMIVHQSWKNGEPGVIFIDAINNQEYPSHFKKEKIRATNPCLLTGCELRTSKGYKKIERLVGKAVDIVTPKGVVSGKVWETGVKDTITLNFNNGIKSISLTPDHVLKTSDGEKIFAKDCIGKALERSSDPEDKYYSDKNSKVSSITYNGPGKVYDFSAPGVNWGFVNGFVVHNCGEEPLTPYGSCNLSAINLGQMIRMNEEDEVFTFDEDKFKYYVQLNVKMLDMILDINDYPLPQIREKSLEIRDIGSGIMGFADLCIRLKIKYGSKECLDLIHYIMSIYKRVAEETSTILGGGKRKNKTLMTIAPTGTTSMFCNASSGIEPYFNFWYVRKIDDKDILVFEGIANEVLSEKQKEYIRNCYKNNQEVDFKKIDFPDYFVRSEDVSWKNHINVQATFQKYIDSAISKTINLPNSATEKEVEDSIMYAWKSGCKGVTVYRDGSRQEQVLTHIGSSISNNPEEYIVKGEVKLPEVMDGRTYKIKAALGSNEPNQSFYIHLGLINNKPVQLFINYKRQSDASSREKQLEAQNIEQLGMSISYQLRYGIPLTVIIKQLKGVPFVWMLSLQTHIANILSNYLDNDMLCDKCHSEIVYKNGCKECSCGASNGCD